jgi:hypothetical protein
MCVSSKTRATATPSGARGRADRVKAVRLRTSARRGPTGPVPPHAEKGSATSATCFRKKGRKKQGGEGHLCLGFAAVLCSAVLSLRPSPLPHPVSLTLPIQSLFPQSIIPSPFASLIPHSPPFHTAASGEGSTAASFLGRRSARIRSCSAAASPAGGLARAPGAGLRGRSSCVTRARCVRIARPAPGACRDSAGRLDLGASACGNQ